MANSAAGLKKMKYQIAIPVFFILILLIILIILSTRFINKFISKRLEVPALPTAPVYLSVPLPDIKDIKETTKHRKLDELRYEKTIFEPVQSGLRGKINPFISL